MTNCSNHSNETAYGIENKALLNTWLGYHVVVLLVSLVGDSTILIGSIKYRALRLNRLLVVVIHHITVCNLLVSATVVLPRAISLTAQQWVAGRWLCYLLGHVHYYFQTVSVLLLCTMTTTKLFVLKFPIRAKNMSAKYPHILCGAVWAAASLIQLCFLLGLSVGNDQIIFDYRLYGCGYCFTASLWDWLIPSYIILVVVIPNVLVIFCTVVMVLHLIDANKKAQSIGRQPRYHGMATTILTALVYGMLYLPYAIYRLGEDYFPDSNRRFHIHYYRLAVSVAYINTLCNFFIYNLAVPSFRKFLWSRGRLVEKYWRLIESNLALLDDYLHYF